MRRTLTIATTAAVLALAACASTGSTATASGDQASSPTVGTSTVKVITSSPTPAPSPTGPKTASQIMTELHAVIPTAKLTVTWDENNDKNHLLGRPHQYTSKVSFKDSRVSASDTAGLEKGDPEFGGSIEVFTSNTDAQKRADYIQTVTQAFPTMAEYDYVQGVYLVRVSHFLTPTQAKAYETFAKGLA